MAIAKINANHTLHDRQCTANETPQSTSSTTFVPVTGATLTTGDLSLTANYTLFFAIAIEASLNNTTASFRFLSDGVPMETRTLFLKVKDQEVGFTFLNCETGIEAGDVFTVEWKTDKGTIEIEDFNFLIDGIQEVRVI